MNVHEGRYAARIEGDFVVFLIGMRFNKLWKVRAWWPVVTAMPKMLRELEAHPELGCRRGVGSTGWCGTPATSASGMRRTGCAPAGTRRCTGTCPALVWREQ